MAQRMLASGNHAIGWGAISAGCLYFFGYPITPQNEVTEWFARELPKRGGAFLQAQCETAAICMLAGAAATGVRVITSTSSPGWALMQEGLSHLANAELPCVVVLVQRGGPGQGTTQHGQMDYLSATRGGGGGGYRNIVLAPASVQESCDLVQLGLHLADKYRNPVVVLSDALIGQSIEVLELRTLDFGSLPEKDWALSGSAFHEDGKSRVVGSVQTFGFMPSYRNYLDFMEHFDKKVRQMEDSEVRYETHQVDDAHLIVVAYGYSARISLEAVNMARGEGLKVGLIRPISLWPFPYEVIRRLVTQESSFLVVEDSLGQLVEDVRSAAGWQTEVHLVNVLSRHMRTASGVLLPDTVFEAIKRLV